jgi:hypothetical protein
MEISVEKDKPWKKQFASFVKEPTRINLRNLLNLEAVEDNDLEFKRELIPFDVLAKHILAMANKNGGAIVFGVDETQANQFSPCGLSKSCDITDIEKKLGAYIPKKLERNIVPVYFKGEEHPELEDKFFLVVIVEFNPRYIPFIALKGGESLQRDTVYIRRNRASEPINHDELQEILNNRIETEYSTTNERKLIEHLEELKELYNHIPRTIRQFDPSSPSMIQSMQAINQAINGVRILPNPDYSQESYESFVKRLIEIKKNIIIEIIKNQ